MRKRWTQRASLSAICGDAIDSGNVARLLGGERAAMCFTDPPYNIGLGDHGGQQRGQRKRRLKNDVLPPEEWEAFVRGWAGNLLDHVDGALYVCMAIQHFPTILRVMEEQGVAHRRLLPTAWACHGPGRRARH